MCIILTTEDRAKALGRPLVYVRGAAAGMTHHSIQAMPDLTVTAGAVTGPKAFAEAGITAADVDTFQMYDSFTYTVLVCLEDLGFAPKGEGGAFAASGALRLGGALPTNTDGGGLSATHPGMRGLFLLCEATRQLRHEAGDSQVDGAEIAVAHGSGGWLSTMGTVVLGTEPACATDRAPTRGPEVPVPRISPEAEEYFAARSAASCGCVTAMRAGDTTTTRDSRAPTAGATTSSGSPPRVSGRCTRSRWCARTGSRRSTSRCRSWWAWSTSTRTAPGSSPSCPTSRPRTRGSGCACGPSSGPRVTAVAFVDFASDG